MPETSHGLRYPTSGDATTLWTYYQNLADDVEANFQSKFTPAKIYAYRSTNQTIGSDLGTPATIVLDATNGTATGLTLNTSTGVITVGASAAGEYTVSGAVAISEVGPSRVFATMFVNGSERLRGLDIINRGATSGDVVGSVVSGPLTLAAGDQVTLRALHTGAAATVAPGVFITWVQLRREA